jgi:hypothetical protein
MVVSHRCVTAELEDCDRKIDIDENLTSFTSEELVMNSAFPQCPTQWKSLYRAAILEPDKSVIRQKVCEAEAAVLARGREVFYSGGTREEKESLEDALYALRAFRTALRNTEA